MLGDLISKFGIVVVDGGLATELEKRGCNIDDPLWSAKVLLEDPDKIEALHRDYFEAGADVGVSASYQASFDGLAKRGVADPSEVMRKSVSILRRARDEFWSRRCPEQEKAIRPRPLAAASVGPFGATLHDGSEYRGEYGRVMGERSLEDWHRRRLEVLATSGADLIAVETVPCVEEARAVARLLQGELRGVAPPAWVTFTAKDSSHVSSGDDFAKTVGEIARFESVAAIGVNCTKPCFVRDLVVAAKSVTEKPIVVYPNSGETYSVQGNSWSGGSDSDIFGQLAKTWYDAGARIIGGCCRTGPDHIKQIASLLRKRV